MLVEGEPGIGKTRFLAEVLADPGGQRLFRADADELERTRPFGPLADALGCRMTSPDQLCAEIARFIDEGAAEFRIVDRFAELLERMALEGNLLVVVDDFQWADRSTVTAAALRHPAPRRRAGHLRRWRLGRSREGTNSRGSSTRRSATEPSR